MGEKFTLTRRIQHLYKYSKWCDLEFSLVDSNTGKTVILSAHRLILASASPVLEALCFGPLAEKRKIIVDDIEANVFELLLQFLYTDKIKFDSVEIASEILYAAKKYMLTDLGQLSSKYLTSNVTDRSCVPLFNLGKLVEVDEIVVLALEHIRRRFQFVKEYIDVGNLTGKLLEALVTSPRINCDEGELVQFAQIWALKVCETKNIEKTGENVRNLLETNNIHHNIRWDDLTESESEEVLPGVLLKDIDVILPSRQPWPLKNVYVHRFSQTDLNTGYTADGVTMCTDVRVSHTVILNGIFINSRCSVMRNSSSDYKESIQMKISKDNVLLHGQHIYQDVEYGAPFFVPLYSKIPLKENCIYVIELKLLKSVLFYPIGKLGQSNKIASVGISVECNDYYTRRGEYFQKKLLGLLTGFDFLY